MQAISMTCPVTQAEKFLLVHLGLILYSQRSVSLQQFFFKGTSQETETITCDCAVLRHANSC